MISEKLSAELADLRTQISNFTKDESCDVLPAKIHCLCESIKNLQAIVAELIFAAHNPVPLEASQIAPDSGVLTSAAERR